jgi:hypothetical protein
MNRFLLPGGLIWCALALTSALGAGPLGLLEILFLLAAWVIVPLGLPFLPDSPPLGFARRIQPFAALLSTVSFFLPKGIPAAALAAPWLAVNGLVALGGLAVLGPAFRGGFASLLLLAAMFFPPVGGIHLVSSRLGYALGGFPEPIILLTAVHFHYTAFAAPVLAALASRAGSGAASFLAKAGGCGIVGSTPLVAAGFIFSPTLKLVAVGLLTVSVLLVAAAQVAALARIPSRKARLLLALSSAAVAAGMLLAAVFEHGFYTGRSWLSIPQMAWSHGLLNGLGFSLGGLLAWSLGGREPRTT